MYFWEKFVSLLAVATLGVVHLAAGAEELASVLTVSASKYDERGHTPADDLKGCYEDGCQPNLTMDDLLNDIPESRWSCEEALEGLEEECFITYDFGELQTFTMITIYFHKSNDTGRTTNPFVISVSNDGTTFNFSFEGVNIAGTAIKEGESFTFSTNTENSGQYLRLTAVLATNQWLSINEIDIFVDAAIPASSPTMAVTASPTNSMAPSPSPLIPATFSPTVGSSPRTEAPTILEPSPAPVSPSPAPVSPSPAPSPSSAPVSPSPTPAPSAANPSSSPNLSTEGGTEGSSDETSGRDIAIIAGSSVAGVGLLVLVAAVVYSMNKAPPPPPPSYDDLVGAA